MAADNHGDTRSRLLEAAATLIAAAPGEDVPLRAICEQVGVKLPTLYHFFGSKQGLLDAVVERGFELYLSEKDATETSADPIQDIRTGWDVHYRRGEAGSAYLHDIVVTGRRPAWPAPEVDTIGLLLERGVRCVGTDAPTMGPAHGDRGQAVHVRGLSEGAVYVECLTGLDRLPRRGAFFCFLPLNVERATGAPGRAVAWLPAG